MHEVMNGDGCVNGWRYPPSAHLHQLAHDDDAMLYQSLLHVMCDVRCSPPSHLSHHCVHACPVMCLMMCCMCVLHAHDIVCVIIVVVCRHHSCEHWPTHQLAGVKPLP